EKFLEIPHLGHWLNGNYEYSFDDAWMEPGYIFVGAFIRLFTENYVFLFVVIAGLSVGVAAYNYYRYSPYLFLTLVLFFVHTFLYRDMIQIRSAVAAAIGLFLISQIEHRQHAKVVVTIAFASLFHMAAMSYILVDRKSVV